MNAAVKTCPCCGQPIAGEIEKTISRLPHPLSRAQQRIVLRLGRDLGRWVFTDALLDAVYFDDPNGGPESASKVLCVQVSWIRGKLAGTDLAIEGRGGPGGGMRRLVQVAA